MLRPAILSCLQNFDSICRLGLLGHNWETSDTRRLNAGSHDTLRGRHVGRLEESAPCPRRTVEFSCKHVQTAAW